MNQCGECTLCCELFEVKQLDKPAYEMCKFCDNGCTIHPTRPQVCRSFDCAWLQSNAHIDIRPDKCGIVFEKIGDDIFHGKIRKSDVLSDLAKRQIVSFIKQGYSVFVNTGENYIVYPVEENRREEIIEKFEREVNILHGGS